jgi:hypothetical protein
MSASPPHLAPDYLAKQRVLLGWVDRLWERQVLTGEILQMGRRLPRQRSRGCNTERFATQARALRPGIVPAAPKARWPAKS